METPANLGAAFVRSTKPRANCRLERATAEMTAGSGSPIVMPLYFFNAFEYIQLLKPTIYYIRGYLIIRQSYLCILNN